nr:R2D2 [Amrasca biguttula biguttula]
MAIFLGENGVLAMGNKTPVTILQETLQKKGIVPYYELIYNGMTDLVPIFKYKVSAEGLSAIGEGKTKKAAKHDAAAVYLRRAQAPRDRAIVENADVHVSEEVNVISPYSGAIIENFVGKLDEVCSFNKLPEAEYTPVSEEGPPHARIFKMQVNVSSVSEVAVARTKKQAKHLAAQQMIDKIMSILGDKFIPIPETSGYDDLDVLGPNIPAIEYGRYQEDLSIPIAKLHNAMFHKTYELPLPPALFELSSKPADFFSQIENPKDFIHNLMEEIGGTCKVTVMPKSSLKEVLPDINRFCELFLEDEPEKEEEIEEEWSSSDENEARSFFNVPDFYLGCSDDENESTSKHTTRKYVEKELPNIESRLKDTMLNSKTIGDISESTLPSPKNVLVMLTVDFTYGLWVFRGYGNSLEEATNDASIKAIDGMRVLSTDPNNQPKDFFNIRVSQGKQATA